MEVKAYQQGADRQATQTTLNVTKKLAKKLAQEYPQQDGYLKIPVGALSELSSINTIVRIITMRMYENGRLALLILREAAVVSELERGSAYINDRNIPEEIRETYEDHPRKGRDNRLQ